jgi:hypothetical protein
MPLDPIYTSMALNVNGTSVTVPWKAKAILTSTNMTGGTGPAQSIRPPGFQSGDCPHHHQRGHLIGNKLGGSGTDERNLVTLTEGTNHPVMYEFEAMVYEKVKSNPGIEFTYEVTARYDATRYFTAQIVVGGAAMGAASNPYCPMPCPESLQIDFFYAESPGHLVYPLPIPISTGEGLAYHAGPLLIPNGVYKFHEGSPKHVSKNCWAS